MGGKKFTPGKPAVPTASHRADTAEAHPHDHGKSHDNKGHVQDTHADAVAAAAAATAPPQPRAAPASSPASASRRPLPLSQRSVDVWIAVWFIVFAFSTTFTDIHNFTASVLGVEVTDLEHRELAYPPKFLTDLYFKWARTVDPLLYQNPVWWQCIEWVNLCVLTPFAFVAPFAFLAGARWVRVPALVVSSFTHYSLILCIGTTLWGPVRSADPGTFTGIYLLYLIQPLLVIARLSMDDPFRRLSATANTVLQALTILNLAVFAAYILKWFVLYQPDWLPGDGAALLAPIKRLP